MTQERVPIGNYMTEYSVRNKGNEDIPVYSVTNSQGFCTEYFDKDVASKDKSTYKIVPRGFFAYNPSRINVGSVDWQRSEERVIVSPLYNVFSVSDELDKQYLFYFLKSDIGKQMIKAKASGSVRDNLKLDMLKEMTIPKRTIQEQKKCVAILDELKKIITLYTKRIEKYDELVKARFVEMFGEPQDNPFGWDKMPLSNVILNANNGMARRGNDENGNIVMRLVELQDGYIDYSNPNRIVLKGNEKTRYLLRDKDFLFARVNGNPDNVGRCAVFEDIGEDVYHNDHIIRVHFNELLLDGTFASVLLNSDYGKRQLKGQIKTSAGQYTVSQDGIGAIVTILPPISLQKEFANFVNQVDKSKIVAQQMLDETQKLFDSLMQEYFG